MEKIGFIGLGNMGAPLAERLLKKYQLVVYDLDENNIKYFTDKGCLLYTSPSPRDQRGSGVPGCG